MTLKSGNGSNLTTSFTNMTTKPSRGEIWRVRFDPHIGDEIGKARPAVVLNSSIVGRLSLSIVVPLTGWQSSFDGAIWLVRVDPDEANGLSKASAADAF